MAFGDDKKASNHKVLIGMLVAFALFYYFAWPTLTATPASHTSNLMLNGAGTSTAL